MYSKLWAASGLAVSGAARSPDRARARTARREAAAANEHVTWTVVSRQSSVGSHAVVSPHGISESGHVGAVDDSPGHSVRTGLRADALAARSPTTVTIQDCRLIDSSPLILVASSDRSAKRRADRRVRARPRSTTSILTRAFDAADAQLAHTCPPAPPRPAARCAPSARGGRFSSTRRAVRSTQRFNDAAPSGHRRDIEAWTRREPDRAEAWFYLAGCVRAARAVARAPRRAACRRARGQARSRTRSSARSPSIRR